MRETPRRAWGAAWVLLLLLALAGPARADWRSETRYFALVIGTNSYEDSVRPALRWAVKDATDLAAVLRDPAHGGFDEVIELRDDATPATRANIWAALDDLQHRMGRNDVVVVYFAGHGKVRIGETGRLEHFLVTADSKEGLLGSSRHPDVAATAISVAALGHFIARKLPAEGKVLIIDACYQQDDRRTRRSVRGAETSSPFRYTLQMLSAGEGYNAQESDSLENGVFTHFLIEGLKGGRPDAEYADAVGDGSVSALEAFLYAGAETLRFTGNEQVPMRVEESFAGAPVVLAGDREERTPSRVLLASGALGRNLRLRGGTLRVRGLGPEAEERVVPVGRALRLPRGQYRIVVERATGRLACSGVFRLRAAEVEVEQLCAAPTRNRVLLGAEVGGTGTLPVGGAALLPPGALDVRAFVGRAFGPVEPRLTLGVLLGPAPRVADSTERWPPSVQALADLSVLVHLGRRGHAAFVGPLGQLRLATGGLQSRPSWLSGFGLRGGWVADQDGQRLLGFVADVTALPLGAKPEDRSWNLAFGVRFVAGIGR